MFTLYWLCLSKRHIAKNAMCAVRNKKILKSLNSLNRLACTTLTVVTRSTPQSSLELIADLPPLDLHIREMALRTYTRIKPSLDNPWTPLKTFDKPHLCFLQSEFDNAGVPNSDNLCSIISSQKRLKINMASLTGGFKHLRKLQVTIYTDGSKNKEGVGAGFAVHYKNKVIHT